MAAIEKGFLIGAHRVDEFVRLLRERSEPWDEPWWTFMQSRAIRCEISHPRFRLRQRAMSGGRFLGIEGQINRNTDNAEIRWTAQEPPSTKTFFVLWLSWVWIVCLVGFFYGKDPATGGADQRWLLVFFGPFMTFLAAGVCLWHRFLCLNQIEGMENHLRTIAREVSQS